MRLAIDQDDVICDWRSRILEWYNQDYGTNIRHEDSTEWSPDHQLGERSRDFVRSCMRYPDFYRDLAPVPGAVDALQQLVEDGHWVKIVSAVPVQAALAYHGKIEWLRRNVPSFDVKKDFVATGDKTIASQWADLLLDDAPHNVEAWAEKKKLAVIFDRPWNKGIEAPLQARGLPVMRIAGWGAFLDLVEKMSPKKGKRSERT